MGSSPHRMKGISTGTMIMNKLHHNMIVPILLGCLFVVGADAFAQSEVKADVRPDYQALLEEQVRDLLPFIEKLTRMKFTATPRVEIPGFDEWADVLKKENPNFKDQSLLQAITIGMYLVKEDRVVMNPGLCTAWLDKIRKKKKTIKPDMRPSLLHELVHVLQEQRLKLNSKRRDEKDEQKRFVLQCLSEGHATLIEELYCEYRLGIKGYFSRRYDRRKHPKNIVGRNYLKQVFLEAGMAKVNRILSGEYPDGSTVTKMGYKDPDKAK